MRKLDWQSVESCIEDVGEQYALESWVKHHAEKKGKELFILEIGSYCGRSTAILAQFGYVLAIDLFGDPYNGMKHYDQVGQNTYEKFRANMVRLELLGTYVHPMISTSLALNIFPPVGFDVIFIDACHQYYEVQADLDRSFPHIAADGIYVLDDYKRPPLGGEWDPEAIRKAGGQPWEGVAQAVDEFIKATTFKITAQARGRVMLER